MWFLEPRLSHWSDWSECKVDVVDGAEPVSKKRRERFCVRKQQQHFAYGNIPSDTVIDQKDRSHAL